MQRLVERLESLFQCEKKHEHFAHSAHAVIRMIAAVEPIAYFISLELPIEGNQTVISQSFY